MKQVQIILNAILSKDIFDYVLIDKMLHVVSASEGVERYLGSAPKVGEDVLSYLPELVGSEDEVQKIFTKKYSLFTLESVYKNNYYVNLSVEYYDQEAAMILFHNITAMTIAKQGILQKSNETALLHSMLQKIIDHQSSLLFVVNRSGEIAFANQRYYEHFGDAALPLYHYVDDGLHDYDALCAYLNEGEMPVNIGEDTFMVQGTQIESTYQLFTLSKITTIAQENFYLSQEVKFDSLTGVYRKKFFDAQVEAMLKTGESFALVVADIDNFKSVNDVHGHLVGDEVLKRFVVEIQGALRQDDVLARWGGEEFVMILKARSIEEILPRVEAIRKRIACYPFRDVKQVTASFGIAWHAQCPCDTAGSMVRRADEAMYTAKKDGKNCVKLASELTCADACL